MNESTLSQQQYAACALCGFWVTKDQASCPNCGIEDPLDTEYWKSFQEENLAQLLPRLGSSLPTGLIAGGLIAGVLSRHVVRWLGLADYLIPICVGIGVLVGGVVFAMHTYYARRFRHRPRDCFQQIEASLLEQLNPPEALRESERQLTARIAELAERGGDTATIEQAREAVRHALAVAETNRRGAHLLILRIAMLRWQNALEPFVIAPAGSGDVAAWQQRLAELDRHLTEGRRLSAEVESAGSSEAGAAPLSVAWQELLAGAERLKDTLLTQHALASVETVTPLEVSVPALGTERVQEAEARARAVMTHDFGDLSRAVSALREQEQRLRGEWETSAQQVRAQGVKLPS